MTLGSSLGTKEATLKEVEEPNVQSMGNQLLVPLNPNNQQNLSPEELKLSFRSRNSSVVSEGKFLDRDIHKVQDKGHSRKIFYKVKRKAVVKWKELSLIWKCIYVIEAPMKFLV